MVWLTDAENAKMLRDIPFPMIGVINDHLALNSFGIFLDGTPQILCKSLLCFAEIGKIDDSKIAKIWLVKFCMFNFKQYISLSFQQYLTILISKSKLRHVLSKIENILKI